MATGYVLERLSELREEAYCKVLRCFLASQQYDLVSSLQPPCTIRLPLYALHPEGHGWGGRLSDVSP
jgi:hypothetical protein